MLTGSGPPSPPFLTESWGLGVKVASIADAVGRLHWDDRAQNRRATAPSIRRAALLLCRFMVNNLRGDKDCNPPALAQFMAYR